MELKVTPYGSPDYEAAFALRDEVLRRPLGLALDEAAHEADRSRQHCIAVFEGQVVAAALVGEEGDGVARISSVAVAESWQGKGVGRMLIGFAEDVAWKSGAKKAIMDSRDIAVGFYERLGYAVVGEEFVKVGIPHRRMEKNIDD